jgi:stage III sporulation protein AB
MLKLIGAILTISSASAMGVYFSTIIKLRLEDLKELKKYIYILRGEIRYGGTPLPEAIGNLAKRSQSNYKDFFLIMSEKLVKLEGSTFLQIWEASVNEDLKGTCLNKKDKESLIRFGENLGYLDKEMQLNTIDLFVSGLEQEIEEMTATVKEKTRLYSLLGVLGGIFITIVII